MAVSATLRSRFRTAAADLAAVGRARPLVVAGQGASKTLASSLGARWLAEGPIEAAEQLTVERAGTVAGA